MTWAASALWHTVLQPLWMEEGECVHACLSVGTRVQEHMHTGDDTREPGLDVCEQASASGGGESHGAGSHAHSGSTPAESGMQSSTESLSRWKQEPGHRPSGRLPGKEAFELGLRREPKQQGRGGARAAAQRRGRQCSPLAGRAPAVRWKALLLLVPGGGHWLPPHRVWFESEASLGH